VKIRWASLSGLLARDAFWLAETSAASALELVSLATTRQVLEAYDPWVHLPLRARSPSLSPADS